MGESIVKVGQVAPILLVPGDTKGQFDIVDGELRFRAIALIKHEDILAVIDPDMTDDQAEEILLACNGSTWTVADRFGYVVMRRKRTKETPEKLHERTGIPKLFIARCMAIADSVAPDLIKILRTSGNSETMKHLHMAASVGGDMPTPEMRHSRQREWWAARGWQKRTEKTPLKKMRRCHVRIKAASIRKRCRIRGIRLTRVAANVIAEELLFTHGLAPLPRSKAA